MLSEAVGLLSLLSCVVRVNPVSSRSQESCNVLVSASYSIVAVTVKRHHSMFSHGLKKQKSKERRTTWSRTRCREAVEVEKRCCLRVQFCANATSHGTGTALHCMLLHGHPNIDQMDALELVGRSRVP